MDMVTVNQNVSKAREHLLDLEACLETALANSGPSTFLHDLLAVSIRNLGVVDNKLQVASDISQKNIPL